MTAGYKDQLPPLVINTVGVRLRDRALSWKVSKTPMTSALVIAAQRVNSLLDLI